MSTFESCSKEAYQRQLAYGRIQVKTDKKTLRKCMRSKQHTADIGYQLKLIRLDAPKNGPINRYPHVGVVAQ